VPPFPIAFRPGRPHFKVEEFFSFNIPSSPSLFSFERNLEQTSRFAMLGNHKGVAWTDQRKESAQAATNLTLAERFIKYWSPLEFAKPLTQVVCWLLLVAHATD
jgi:hypothetical protein